MSSLLRSSKFVRYFVGAARNIVVSSGKNPLDNNLISPIQTSITQNLIRCATTQAQSQYTSNLEKSLQQLDQDVRRVGRISRREIEEVLEEIRHSKTATSSQSLLIIRCCGNLVPEELPHVRTKLVQKIWSTLENLKVPMDISHYNALLRVYIENEHAFSPAEFLQDLEKKGIEPNRVTYQRLITRYCQAGDIEGATRILEFMREKSLPVNESVFNALIMGHSQAEDMESALGILSVMKQAGLEPSSDTYTTLLIGYSKVGDFNRILALLEECDQKDIYLLDKDYLDVAFALATSGHDQHIEEILKRTRKSSGYNQDAVSYILRLVNQGKDDAALKIFRTMARIQREGNIPINSGTFFIRQLVKAQRPVEKIIQMCKIFENEGIHSKPLLIATEASLQLAKVEMTCSLLQAVKQSGSPVRQHYFWPLMAAAGKEQNDEKIIDILTRMASDFEIPASGETIREFVIPNLSFSDSDFIIGYLKKAGIPVGTCAVSIIFDLLQEGALAKAADTASKYRAFYSPSLLRRPLVAAFFKTLDSQSFLNVLHHICENLDRMPVSEENETVLDRKVVTGEIILDILHSSRNHLSLNIKQILQGLLERGLGISTEHAEAIQSRLSGEVLTNEVSMLLTQLTAPDLEQRPAVRNPIPESAFPSSEQESHETIIRRLYKRIERAELAEQPVAGLKRMLLTELCKNGDVDEAEVLFKGLQSDTWPGSYAQLVDAFIAKENIEKAEEYFNKMQTEHPGSGLDSLKIARFVELYVKSDKIENALKILDTPKPEQSTEFSFNTRTTLFRALNILAEKGDAENLEKLFNKIIESNHVEVSNVILGPLIKVHIVRGDLQKALERFTEMCEKYKMTPWKGELARKFIEAENAEFLQRLTDLSTSVHGEMNSLYDLVFTFVECGRIRQARKILETPGLRDRPQRLSAVCERYQQEGSLEALERLAEATRDITHIDRTEIFNNLLKLHIRMDDTDKALALWTQMQDEDVQPTDNFLWELGSFLVAKGVKVPFIVPTTSVSATTSEVPKAKEVTPAGNIAFKNAIRLGKIGQALEIKRDFDLRNIQIPAQDQSLLIEGLCQTNCLDNAVDVALQMLEKKQRISEKHFRFLIVRLSTSGEYRKIEQIGELINWEQKKRLSFDNRLCAAYLVAQKGSEYLDLLLNEISNAKSETISQLEEKFPKGTVTGILDTSPELLPKLQQIAIKYYEYGSKIPMNSLWISYFLQPEGAAMADAIWEQYKLANVERLMFQKIIINAKRSQNFQLMERLIEKLDASNISINALGVAYSASLDILVSRNQVEEALSKLQLYLKKVPLTAIHSSTLQGLKQLVELQGQTFPYVIPPRKRLQQSAELSSSSSDDEHENNIKQSQSDEK